MNNNELIKSQNEIKKEESLESTKNPFRDCSDGRYQVQVKSQEVSGEPVPVKNPSNWIIFIYIFVGAIGLFLALFITSVACKSQKVTVSARVDISIQEIKDKAVLHVLTVSDSVVITENEKNNNKGITAWTKFTGTGDFVVDLQKSEFLIDKARKTVIVKTPEVTIDKDNFSLDYNDTESLFFADSGANESYKYGVDIAESQFNEAYLKIYDELYTNPYYFDSAKSAAEKIIKSLVLSFNKGVEDLTVIVEVGALS